MLKWRAAAITNAGCQRERNEDNYYVSPDTRVFVVADGMGGAVGGARASQLAVEAIQELWNEKPPHESDQQGITNWLEEAVARANHAVFQAGKKDASVHGMGTTVVVGVQSTEDHLQIAHVGDSRAYLLRNGQPKLLTTDHSVVQEMVRAGRLTEEQARINPYKNLITRCLGHEPEVEVDQTPVDLRPSDWIVLCTDGLSTVLRDEQISAVIDKDVDPQDVCDALVKLTLDGGAPDNVTVVAIQYLDNNSSNK